MQAVLFSHLVQLSTLKLTNGFSMEALLRLSFLFLLESMVSVHALSGSLRADISLESLRIRIRELIIAYSLLFTVPVRLQAPFSALPFFKRLTSSPSTAAWLSGALHPLSSSPSFHQQSASQRRYCLRPRLKLRGKIYSKSKKQALLTQILRIS